MDCRQAQQLFDAYLDGELSPSLATELGAHRVQCADCRRALALLEVSGHIISADHDEIIPDEAFTDRLLACMDEPNPAITHQIWRVATIGGGLAAAALVALAFLGMFDTGNRGVVAGVREEGTARPPVATLSSTTLPVATFDELLDDSPPASSSTGAFQELASQSRQNSGKPSESINVLGKVLKYTTERGIGVLERASEQAAPIQPAVSPKPANSLPAESDEAQVDVEDAADSEADE